MKREQETKEIVICGIGNTLLQDEGVGVHAVRELKKMPLPPSVVLIEGGTMLLDFLFQMQEARQVILIDAMKADGPPGSIYLLDAQQLTEPQADHPLSLHQVDAVQVLRIMALEKDPPPCLVIGIEPASLEWGLELSEIVKGKMPEILQVVQGVIHRALSNAHS
jgi:hydrogenase maturation protease